MQPKNFSHYWCTVMVEELINEDIDHFFVAPGSRSTPIVSAIVHNSDSKISWGIDERSIGFMALGYSKYAQRPGAIVVTSGTAVANLYPCVVEAFLSQVPLLLITADRPYELRDCGANQTIVQATIFANHINKSFDLAPPASVVCINQSKALLAHAARYTKRPKKGPVHVNIQLREPLANVIHDNEPYWRPVPSKRENLILTTHIAKIDIDGLKDFLSSTHGLLVVGELLPSGIQNKLLELSELIKWPIYADIISNLRLRHHPNIIHHFDCALLSNSFVKELNIGHVIKFGSRIVSKRFWAWVEKNHQAQFISINESSERIDPTGCFKHVHVDNLECALTNVIEDLTSHTPLTRSVFTKASLERISCVIDNFLEQKCNNEAYFAARLIAHVSEPVNLFVSSSMPIRDLDQFAKPTDIPIAIFANRGASGIDGVVSSAAGVAIADSKPVILLIGDVAFLHDTNGLMLLTGTKAPVLVVVINNNGGGIFHFLPIAYEADVITPYLDTPHHVHLRSLCTAHGIGHELIATPKDFDEALRQFFIRRESRVLEIMIKREKNVNLHKNLYREIEHI
jgi:2-succinyl-5-enolpyruvyl-6-hydroxy-3-cyclohexene-1-carboxylate synthase